MQKYNIVILDSVKTAIRKNFDYIVNTYENEPAAITHTIDIYKEIKSLETFPKIHPIYEGRKDKEFRIAHIRHYRIFYRIDEQTHTIYVERIYHSHQNPENLHSD